MSQYELVTISLAALTSIIILLTLFEIKNQRESIYKPDLILNSSLHFYMYSEKNGDVYLPSLWASEHITLDETEKYQIMLNNPNRNKIGAHIFNIGMGTAKNIKIEWEYDKKSMRDLISNGLKNEHYWPINRTIKTTIPLQRDLKFNQIDYILPSQIKSSSEKAIIPVEFQNDFNLFLAVYLQNLNFNDIPQLKVNISYFDIANQKHVKKFLFSFKFNSWGIKDIIGQKYAFNAIDVDIEINEV